MTLIRSARDIAALLLLGVSGSIYAFNYDESVNGDLAGTLAASGGANPTVLTAVPGINSIALGVPPGGDRDYFTFAVPQGYLLSSIQHTSYVSADNLSFIALQRGAQLTEPLPPATNSANLLGYLHFGPATAGTEIIDDLAASGSSTPAAQGCPRSAPAWAQRSS